MPIRPDATYLVTGGLGRLGLHAARWLVGRGARRLCLVGRSGAASVVAHAGVSALESQGVRVRVAAADVTDADAMASLVAEVRHEADLRGVIHAAGRPGYADIAQLTREDLAAVVAPKIDGAWTLHELTRDAPLDFFVCFSSIASAWGSRGQAHYAAGNGFLDALAYVRRTMGLPAVTIDWGPWGEGGMTSPEAEALLRRVGIRPLAVDVAVAALDGLASGERPQPVVADVDWALFRGSYEARGHRRLLQHLGLPVATGTPAGDRTDLVRGLDAASASERERLLGNAVEAELVQVLGLPAGSRPDLEQGLFEMGIDSLMALELRTRLQTLVGRALPPTLVLDCPTVLALSRFLGAALWPAPLPEDTRAAAPTVQPVVRQPSPDLDALSDDDAEALLLKTIESIH